MPTLTLLNCIIAYLVASYVIGIVWFLILERKEGYTKWRFLATAVAPLAFPLLLLAVGGLKMLDVYTASKDAE